MLNALFDRNIGNGFKAKLFIKANNLVLRLNNIKSARKLGRILYSLQIILYYDMIILRGEENDIYARNQEGSKALF